MVFAVSPKQTTLYDQMRYTGAPSSFAWVLPIGGQVTIGLSSDELFNALDSLTSVQVLPPEMNCYTPPSCMRRLAMPQSAVGGLRLGSGGGAGGGGVTVFAHEVVGPYETVQLRATDPKALATWLTEHHYEISKDAQEIIDAYVKEKSAFLAMKLVPGATVSAMRPVRVTSPGASVTLPLRMVAAGAGASLGVTLWVVSEGRYEPQNFPAFTIAAAEVVWDWKTSSSNYSTLRAAKTKASDSMGWQIESSLDVQRQELELQLAITPPRKKPAPRADAGPEPSEEEQRRTDLDTLFGGNSHDVLGARVTRMRADLSHAALAKDLRVQASASQALLTNVVQVTRESEAPQCPVYDEICITVGSAPRPEAEAKNKALKDPHFDGDTTVKKRFSCAASPGAPSSDGVLALGVLCVAGLALVRRRRPQ